MTRQSSAFPRTTEDVPRPALLLTPSRALGGGIERYVETLEWAFGSLGIECHRIDLQGSGSAAQARLLAESRRRLVAMVPHPRLIVVHRALLPAASLLAHKHAGCGISLVCHGIEIWSTQRRVRAQLERWLMERSNIRVVAVSNFTAGVVSKSCPTVVLPPGLSRVWFDTLVHALTTVPRHGSKIHLVTAFRLADWRDKGLPELLAAVASLHLHQVEVTVCGSGGPTQELQNLVDKHPFCTLRTGLTDHELARELAGADLFVLATRTRYGRRPCGEGFGLVLLEAQIAGTPVVGPAFGGSHDAFLDHVTGIAPVDETVGSLAKVLRELLNDPTRLEEMGKRAAGWARESSSPELYASRAVARLL